jgi:hypothetical protein
VSFPGASRQSRIPSPAEGVNRGDLLAASGTCLALHEAPTVAGEILLGTSARGDIATTMRLQLQSAGGPDRRTGADHGSSQAAPDLTRRGCHEQRDHGHRSRFERPLADSRPRGGRSPGSTRACLPSGSAGRARACRWHRPGHQHLAVPRDVSSWRGWQDSNPRPLGS